jgi:hypothetical protein
MQSLVVFGKELFPIHKNSNGIAQNRILIDYPLLASQAVVEGR